MLEVGANFQIEVSQWRLGGNDVRFVPDWPSDFFNPPRENDSCFWRVVQRQLPGAFKSVTRSLPCCCRTNLAQYIANLFRADHARAENCRDLPVKSTTVDSIPTHKPHRLVS